MSEQKRDNRGVAPQRCPGGPCSASAKEAAEASLEERHTRAHTFTCLSIARRHEGIVGGPEPQRFVPPLLGEAAIAAEMM